MLHHWRTHRRGATIPAAVVLLITVATIGIGWLIVNQDANQDANQSATTESTASLASQPADAHLDQGSDLHPVHIRPGRIPRVDTGLRDEQGIAIEVSCSTCHATRKPNTDNRTAHDMNEFHTDLTFSHGSISCLSCHNPDDYDSLKLADGSRVEFENVMTLCAQCHGPQTIDYHHGAHGGMNGHWDLKRGPRTRNNCVDCHNPHSPQFPHMLPTFKPRDRFLERPAPSESGQHD